MSQSFASPRRYRVFDPGLYHEVTQRIRDGKFLLDPNCPDLKAAIYGQLAVSMRRYGVTLVALHFMTDHFHALYGITCPYKFAKFLAHFHAGITRAYNKLRGADTPQRDYRPVRLWDEMGWFPVATDEKSVSWRIRYIMGQAVAAKLVDHPIQFPGASTIDAMIDGTPMTGKSYDATARYRDSRLKAGASPDDAYLKASEVTISPPGCWAHLSPLELRQKYIDIADSVARVPLAELRRGKQAVPVQPTGAHPEPDVAEAGEFRDPGPWQVPPASGDFAEEAGEKCYIPPRVDEAGQPFEAGAPQPKKSYYTSDGKRKRRPLILAWSESVCQAYEEAYSEWVSAYLQAKSDCQARMAITNGGLGAPGLVIPPFMLLGSMPYPRTE